MMYKNQHMTWQNTTFFPLWKVFYSIIIINIKWFDSIPSLIMSSIFILKLINWSILRCIFCTRVHSQFVEEQSLTAKFLITRTRVTVILVLLCISCCTQKRRWSWKNDEVVKLQSVMELFMKMHCIETHHH